MSFCFYPKREFGCPRHGHCPHLGGAALGTLVHLQAEAGPRKRGAPVGHPGWFRPTPTEYDALVEVAAPTDCPRCGGPVRRRHPTEVSPAARHTRTLGLRARASGAVIVQQIKALGCGDGLRAGYPVRSPVSCHKPRFRPRRKAACLGGEWRSGGVAVGRGHRSRVGRAIAYSPAALRTRSTSLSDT
jgi:hypothetical protein